MLCLCMAEMFYRDKEYHQQRIIILFPLQMMSSCALGAHHRLCMVSMKMCIEAMYIVVMQTVVCKYEQQT